MTSPDFASLLDSLFNLQRFGIKLGLEHTAQLLKALGNPHDELTLIHIAGTNGKGSTCAMIASILRQSGKKVGLYTSPHLIGFNERIRVNGIPISNDEITLFMKKADSAISRIESTFFETTSVMALDHFKNQNVDVGVIETGLGGRLDSTNVILPSLTVMTPISMDHMDILGNSLEAIGKEKAGIIKKKIPVVSANQQKFVKNILQQKSIEMDAPFLGLSKVSQISIQGSRTNFRFKSNEYYTSLLGHHQAQNAALAVECIQQFDHTIQQDVIQAGLNKVIWPGRIQPVGERLFYDVAHNEDGINSMLKTIRCIYPKETVIGLFCLKGDKELGRLIPGLREQLDYLLVTTDQNGLLLSAEELSRKLLNVGLVNELVPTVSKGIQQLKDRINDRCVGIIFGSHYIADEVYKALEIPFDGCDI